MSLLVEQPCWLDASDRQRMATVMQASSRPLTDDYVQASGNWRYDRVWQEWPCAKAIHRVVSEGLTPGRAIDEAIPRIKQILGD